ncbi:hypothetical protein Rhopal_007636-T1 [Rhodotorula paludigena]|uniref:Uncharacterized protein n=1 Tax=Rhodotorula paludigena TaxID=86838 RepID=A0AAV5H1E3_9BASI|nr:hypothetical protein Rhopal_007636-T1 [Rhodotorula paludigena]
MQNKTILTSAYGLTGSEYIDGNATNISGHYDVFAQQTSNGDADGNEADEGEDDDVDNPFRPKRRLTLKDLELAALGDASAAAELFSAPGTYLSVDAVTFAPGDGLTLNITRHLDYVLLEGLDCHPLLNMGGIPPAPPPAKPESSSRINLPPSGPGPSEDRADELFQLMAEETQAETVKGKERADTSVKMSDDSMALDTSSDSDSDESVASSLGVGRLQGLRSNPRGAGLKRRLAEQWQKDQQTQSTAPTTPSNRSCKRRRQRSNSPPAEVDLGAVPILGSTFTIEVKKWATPLACKANTFKFSIKNACYQLGSNELGRLYLIMRPTEAAKAEETALAPRTALPLAQAEIVTDFISQILLDDPAFTNVYDLRVSKGKVQLDWMRMARFQKVFMDKWPTLQRNLGLYGLTHVPRFALLSYGKDIQVSQLGNTSVQAAAVQRLFDPLIIANNVERFHFAIANNITARRVNRDGSTTDLAILCNIDKFRAMCPHPKLLTGYPIGMIKGFGNVYGATAAQPVIDAVGVINHKLATKHAERSRPVRVIHSNIYWMGCKQYRPNLYSYVAVKGEMTAAYCATKDNIGQPLIKRCKSRPALIHRASTRAPRDDTLDALNITVNQEGKAGLRAEHVFVIEVNQLREEHRNWSWIINQIFVPVEGVVVDGIDALQDGFEFYERLQFPRVMVMLVRVLWIILINAVSELQKPNSSSNVGSMETLSVFERLVHFALSGSVQSLPTTTLKTVGCLQNLKANHWPYFDPSVLDIVTGKLKAHKWASPLDTAQFSFTAAIAFHYGPEAAALALQHARQNLVLMRTTTLGNTLTLPRVTPFIRAVVDGCVTETQRYCAAKLLDIVNTNAKRGRQDAAELEFLTYNEDAQMLSEAVSLKHDEDVKVVEEWANSLQPFLAKSLEPVFAALSDQQELDFAQQKLTNLVTLTPGFSHHELARFMMALAFNDDSQILKSDRLIGSLPHATWTNVLKSLGPFFGIGNLPGNALAPFNLAQLETLLIDQLHLQVDMWPVGVKNGTSTVPSISVARWRKMDKTIVIPDDDESDSEGEVEILNPQAVADTMDRRSRQLAREADNFLAHIGIVYSDTLFKDNQPGNSLCVSKRWQQAVNEFVRKLPSVGATVHTKMKSDGHRSAANGQLFSNVWTDVLRAIKPAKPLHKYVIITAFVFTASSDEAFPIISQKAKKANLGVYTVADLEYRKKDNKRSRNLIVVLWTTFALCYLDHSVRRNVVQSDLSWEYFVSPFTDRNLSCHDFVLAGFGKPKGIRPNWPHPSTSDFDVMSITPYVKELHQALVTTVETAIRKKNYISLFCWCYPFDEALGIIRSYIKTYEPSSKTYQQRGAPIGMHVELPHRILPAAWLLATSPHKR